MTARADARRKCHSDIRCRRKSPCWQGSGPPCRAVRSCRLSPVARPERPCGIQTDESDHHGGSFQFIIALDARGYAAAVVLDGDGIIGMDDDAYLVAMSCQSFVDGVVQHFEHQM